MPNIFKDDGLEFDWSFENACLGNVKRLYKNWYFLEYRPDCWFWFHFKVKGCKGRTIIFEVNFIKTPKTGGDQWHSKAWIHHPYLSYNNGADWQCVEHVEDDFHLDHIRFSHTFSEDEVEICFGIPYTVSNLKNFLKTIDHPDCEKNILGYSRSGFPISLLTIASRRIRSLKEKKGIWLLYREDTNETITSFAAEGGVRFLLSDEPVAVELRNEYEFNIVPMSSMEGTMAGTTFSAGYGYLTNRWNEDPGPDELRPIKQAITAWVAEGNKLCIAGKHHGNTRFHSKGGSFFWVNSIPLGQALANNVQHEAYFQLLIRNKGRFERWIIDTFGFVPAFLTELAVIFSPDKVSVGSDVKQILCREARICGEGIIRALGEFLQGRISWDIPRWRE